MVLAYVAKTYSLEVKDKYYQKIPLTEFSKKKKEFTLNSKQPAPLTLK